jgi:hypothetical protein
MAENAKRHRGERQGFGCAFRQVSTSEPTTPASLLQARMIALRFGVSPHLASAIAAIAYRVEALR